MVLRRAASRSIEISTSPAASQTFTGDVSNLQGSYVGNDTATSVRIEPGCRARLYADADYRGSYLEVDRDVSDLRRLVGRQRHRLLDASAL